MITIKCEGREVLCATDAEALALITALEANGFEFCQDEFDISDFGYVGEEELREADKFAAYGY